VDDLAMFINVESLQLALEQSIYVVVGNASVNEPFKLLKFRDFRDEQLKNG
jgi:hypothetical protein